MTHAGIEYDLDEAKIRQPSHCLQRVVDRRTMPPPQGERDPS
jgi:hypothetical protein